MPVEQQTDIEKQATVVEQLDTLVGDILEAVKKPSLTSILVVVQQAIGFVVFFGIINAGQQGDVMVIINAGIGLVVLIVHAVNTYSAHKAAAAITQAKTDLLATGWPVPPGNGAVLGRVGSRLAP